MLESIKVESFKSLESVEVHLGSVNVFIGANGSGKSNLLEAVGVIGAAANGRVDDEALLRRGVRPGLPALYKSSFKGSRQPPEIRFTASNGDASYAVGLYNPMSKPEPAWRFKTELLVEQGQPRAGRSPRSKLVLDPASGYAALKAVEILPESYAGRLLSDLRQYAIYSPDTATLRGLDSDPQSREPLGLSGGRLAEAVEEVFLEQDLDPEDKGELVSSVMELIGWSRGFGTTGASSVPVSKSVPQPARILRFRDRYMADGRDYLSAYDASEGALYVLFMMALLHHEHSPRVLSVDNFDHALNPRLAKALTRKICDWVLGRGAQQVLMTSHNPLVLDGLPLSDERVRLFTVQRTAKGKTIVSRVEVDESLLKKAEEGVPLSQQWVMGSFGGVPRNL